MKHPASHLLDAVLLPDLFAHVESRARRADVAPSPAQADAGNYRKGRLSLQGLDIAIENPRGSVRSGVAPDGTAWSNTMAAHYGYIGGTRGADGDEVDVFIGPLPESGSAWVVNQRDPRTGAFDEHKVMLGFSDEDQARDAYQLSYDREWGGLMSIVPLSLSQLRRWLASGDMSGPLAADQLTKDAVMLDKVKWTAEGEPSGVDWASVVYGLRRHDDGGLMLDAVTQADIEGDPEVQGEVMLLDALVIEAGRLKNKMLAIERIFNAAGSSVKVTKYTIANPVKYRGVLQVAVIFDLSDGQTVTIWFHNAESSPSRLSPADELISWRWLLNKLDVTIVVAPERGRDLNIRDVARRIMKLADKNAERFAQANAKLVEMAQQHENIDAEIAALTVELSDLERKIEVAKIDREEADEREAAQAKADAAREEAERAKAEQDAAEAAAQEAARAAEEAEKQALEAQEQAAQPVAVVEEPEAAAQPGNEEAVTEAEVPTPSDIEAMDDEPFDPSVEPIATDLSAIPRRAVVRLSGDEVLSMIRAENDDGEPIAPEKQAFDAAREYFRANVQGRTFTNKALGRITVNGSVSWGKIKKALDYNELRVKLLAAIPALLRFGTYAGVEDPDKDRSDGALQFHYMAAWVRVGSQSVEVGVSIVQKSAGKFMYNLADWPSKLLAKKQSRIVKSGLGPTDPAQVATVSGDDDENLAQPIDDVNSDAVLDDAANGVMAGVALNLYILRVVGSDGVEVSGQEDPEAAIATPALSDTPSPEAESPAVSPELVSPAARVDAAYRFGDATERFKEYIADTVDDAEYSMFATSKAMDETAIGLGAAIAWDIKSMELLDSVASDVPREVPTLDADGAAPVLDGVDDEYLVIFGAITKDGEQIGRALVAGDGKAMVYVGAEGNQRVKFDSGLRAMWSDDDATEMVRALVTVPQTDVVEQEQPTVAEVVPADAGADAPPAAESSADEPDPTPAAVESPAAPDDEIEQEVDSFDVTPEEYKQIAATIYAQMGGPRLKAMTGARDFVSLSKGSGCPFGGLQFRLPSSFAKAGINLVVIKLNGEDTYDVYFNRVRGRDWKNVETVSGVYADGLQETFTSVTGLDTSLGSAATKSTPARVTKKAANEAYDSLQFSVSDLRGHLDVELMRVDVPARLTPKIEAVKSLQAAGWPEDVADPSSLIDAANDLIARWRRLKDDGLTRDMGRGEAELYLRTVKGLTPDQVDAILAKPSSVDVVNVGGSTVDRPSYTMDYLNSAADAANTSEPSRAPELADPAAEEKEANAVDLTYKQVDDMFTAFYPETEAGKAAWNEMAKEDGIAKVLNQHVGDAIAQLRAAGYRVAKKSGTPLPNLSDDELLAELAPSAGEGESSEAVQDRAFLHSLIDGTADMLDEGIADRLEAMLERYADNPEMAALLTSAANAYSDAVMKAAQEAMAPA
jgi:hypothetical protein